MPATSTCGQGRYSEATSHLGHGLFGTLKDQAWLEGTSRADTANDDACFTLSFDELMCACRCAIPLTPSPFLLLCFCYLLHLVFDLNIVLAVSTSRIHDLHSILSLIGQQEPLLPNPTLPSASPLPNLRARERPPLHHKSRDETISIGKQPTTTRHHGAHISRNTTNTLQFPPLTPPSRRKSFKPK